ncbi:MAG TPA: phosphatidate cytidylyltransferase, partial [Alphaproteobacteria bacterium]|nr:phosphatidate cytidylyltransferase [Alphaproteobacteria bacterium]
MMKFLDNPVQNGIAVIVALLLTATVISFVLKKVKPAGDFGELSDRIKSWWIMIAIFSTALLTSPVVSVIFFGLLSFLAFKEYVSVIPLRKVDRRVLLWAYLTIPLQYILVANNQYGLFIVFIPVWVFFLLPFRLILAKQTDGF